MNPIIVVDRLSFTYPDGRQALQNASFTAFRGEKIALVGANGAGKSTLLLHLNGIFEGLGQIWIDGLRIKKNTLKQIRARVGMVFQNPDDQLFSPTVFEDVAYGPIYQGLSKELIRQRVEEALAAVQMSQYRDRNPYHLSSGEKKRVAIATVLSMLPQLLLLDEPTAGLDPRARRELIGLLRNLPQTMLIATHDLDMAKRLTTRTIILTEGEIAADGPTAEVLSDHKLLEANGLW